MSTNHPVFDESRRVVAADFATPRTCSIVVVTDVDGTLRDSRTGSLAPADLALSLLPSPNVRYSFAEVALPRV